MQVLRLDHETLGQRSVPRVHDIERGAVRKFSAALGFQQESIYVSADEAKKAGYRDLVAPPTFAVTLLPWELPGIELPSAGVLHGEQEFEWDRPICAGDRVVVTGWVDEVKSRSGQSGQMTLITIASEAALESGEPLFRARALLVVTEEAENGSR
jgi:acyl dehydratase